MRLCVLWKRGSSRNVPICFLPAKALTTGLTVGFAGTEESVVVCAMAIAVRVWSFGTVSETSESTRKVWGSVAHVFSECARLCVRVSVCKMLCNN